MTKADLKKSIELAQSVLQKNCLDEPPVIAKEIAENAGLKVVAINFAAIDNLYANISGFIDINSHTLYVNSTENPRRQNFTIAHELGHYLLGHTSNAEYGELLFRKPLCEQEDPIIEQEANCFAANLLVPENMLKKVVSKYSFITDVQLANLFGVSEIVIRYRKKHLGV